MKNIKATIFSIILALILVVLVLILVKGNVNDGKVMFQSNYSSTGLGKPFESSGSTSRFALTASLVDNKSFTLSEDLARFSSPDVSEYRGKYFTIFTPGVSFIGVPFYILGNKYGLPQLFTYLSTSLFAILNVFLIAKIIRRLNGGFYVSYLSGVLFLFATSALSYATTFTQHQASTFVILLAILVTLGKTSLLKNFLFGLLFGIGLTFDIPNGILMAPLGVYILSKNIVQKKKKESIKINLQFKLIGLLVGIVPIIFVFGWYNYNVGGSYTFVPQISARRIKDFANTQITQPTGEVSLPSEEKRSGIRWPFNSRGQIKGLSIFLISNERAIPVFAPTTLFGILGLLYLIKRDKYKKIALTIFGVFLINLIAYSMFGDPWGGWTFGPRYLIPGLAMLSIGTGFAIIKYNKSYIFKILFILLGTYGIAVNTLGVMTTTQVPPKVEAVALQKPVPYTYERNWLLLNGQNLNSTLFYNSYIKDKISSRDFAIIYAGVVSVLFLTLYLVAQKELKARKYEK